MLTQKGLHPRLGLLRGYEISSNSFNRLRLELFIQFKTIVFTFKIVFPLFLNIEFARDVTHGFLLYVTLCFAHNVMYLIKFVKRQEASC